MTINNINLMDKKKEPKETKTSSKKEKALTKEDKKKQLSQKLRDNLRRRKKSEK